MRLLTLNTHSLAEDQYEEKLEAFLAGVTRIRPHVMALQEVNQPQNGMPQSPDTALYTPCRSDITVRQGNHALSVARGLAACGLSYHWSWLPVKRGYEIYDEGVAMFSLSPIEETDICHASRLKDYHHWKTRALLGIRTGGYWFYSLHLGWWDDPEEPFAAQWERVDRHVRHRGQVFLMGDFNSPAEVVGEGYDLMRQTGWHDTYASARHRDAGITVRGKIPGWTHRDLPEQGARVDHILCNFPCRVASSRVVFDQTREPVVSDHFGVLVETEDVGSTP